MRRAVRAGVNDGKGGRTDQPGVGAGPGQGRGVRGQKPQISQPICTAANGYAAQASTSIKITLER